MLGLLEIATGAFPKALVNIGSFWGREFYLGLGICYEGFEAIRLNVAYLEVVAPSLCVLHSS